MIDRLQYQNVIHLTSMLSGIHTNSTFCPLAGKRQVIETAIARPGVVVREDTVIANVIEVAHVVDPPIDFALPNTLRTGYLLY